MYHQQNGGGIYYSNAVSYQQNVDARLRSDMKLNEEMVEVSEAIQSRTKTNDLDELCKEGKLKEAVELLGLLEREGLQIDLPQIHGVDESMRTYNQILEMYSKCGSMVDAFAVFDQMPKTSGLKPDGQIFIGVFSACGVLGDLVEGILHFESMSKDYGIVPSMEHYVSVVDMLGIAGCLDEALEFIEKMPIEPGIEIWETLMSFYRCAELVQHLDPTRLNEHSMAGLIPIDAREIAKEKEEKKLSGQNLLDVRGRVHEYRAGDRSHPDHERIYALLRGLKQQMKEVGYAQETKFVLHDVDQEAKEEALMAHSERLAAAQGFLTSPARSPMRCDCHNAFKIISKIVGREIIARDSKRFHHFRDGSCSCNDYW
ncbi:hypothetical protein Pfo_019863 [Paulownia fortunei]|nr:hypothetical protein Pfo_019863 [Paulownia fortunei]